MTIQAVAAYANSLYGKSNKALFRECLELYVRVLQDSPKEIETFRDSITIERNADGNGNLNNPIDPHRLTQLILGVDNKDKSRLLGNQALVTCLHPTITELGLYTVRCALQTSPTELIHKDLKVWIVPTAVDLEESF